jgi:hypothetical protein
MKRIIPAVLLVCGLVSARANLFQYNVNFSGLTEGTTSAGTGTGTVFYNDLAHTLQVMCTFSGLTNFGSGTTASHIHAATANPFTGTAGVATTTPTFAGFPLGVTSGSYSNTLDLTSSTSWNPTFVTANGGSNAGAEAALFTAMNAGESYWNIHSQAFPGGEIRGFLVPVPEPSSFSVLGLGGITFAVRSWLRKRAKKS